MMNRGLETMATNHALPADLNTELQRRHKSTATTVLSLLIAVVLLCVLAFVSQKFLTPKNSGSLDMIVNISIVIFGFGAIALRRTKFAKMRLQDIAALQGARGLIITLQKTTMIVALIGVAIALIGFVTTLVTADAWYTLKAGVVAAAVLLYGYPVRRSWEQAVRQFSPGDSEPEIRTN
jgi:hypothetical protein